jgi:bidirectional [NiFe] hydrogenase diaphorase subunit
MSAIHLQIDGREVIATPGTTLLEAARSVGITIPTLCHHEKLEPFGACRICVVEADTRKGTQLVASCVSPVEEGLVVRTRSERVDRVRKSLLELMLAHAPDSPVLQELAAPYGAERDRFEKEASFCIQCGLCVRYCAEVVQKHAVGFVERGTKREIGFVAEIAARECSPCKACFPLCPTSYLQAAFVLTEAFASRQACPGST